MKQQYDLAEILEYINPCVLDYQEWVNVGMALKDSGYSVDTCDTWSRRDNARYHNGECLKNGTPFVAGTQ